MYRWSVWGQSGSLGFQEHRARGGNLLNFDAGPPPHHPRHDVERSHGQDGAPPPHHGHDEGSGAGLVGPADSRAGHWVRGAGKDGTTELLRGGGTSLFFFVLILVILGNSWDSQSLRT